MVDKLLKVINNYKWKIIFWLCLVLSIVLNVFAIKSCSDTKTQSNNNVIALTDSIKYYKTKTGETYVSKTLLDGDLKTLQLANDSLAKVINGMKISDPSSVVYIKNTIENETHDTTWIVKRDTTYVSREFAFNNQYRTLEGKVYAQDSILGLNINKDLVYFDYTLAIEDNKVYLKSNNPYIKYNSIQGLTLPTTKKKKWSLGIGPSVTYGYDFVAKKFGPTIGVSVNLSYNLLSW